MRPDLGVKNLTDKEFFMQCIEDVESYMQHIRKNKDKQFNDPTLVLNIAYALISLSKMMKNENG